MSGKISIMFKLEDQNTFVENYFSPHWRVEWRIKQKLFLKNLRIWPWPIFSFKYRPCSM